MMKTERTIKKQAREAMAKENWPTLVGCLAIVLLIFFTIYYLYVTVVFGLNIVDAESGYYEDSGFVPGLICSLALIVCLFAASPIISGFFKLCFNVAKSKKCQSSDLLYYFKSPRLYFTALILNTVRLVSLSLAYSICMIPANIVNLAAESFDSVYSVYFSVFSITLTVIGVFAVIIIFVKFLLSDFILAENDNKNALFYIGESFRLSKGHTIDILKLLLSFTFWIVSCFFVLPIFYVIPYMGVSVANSAKWLILLKKEERPQQC